MQALVINEEQQLQLQEIEDKQIPATAYSSNADIDITIHYSTINYKDALILGGNQAKLVRTFPMVPGIDMSGIVSKGNSTLPTGSKVVRTGYGYGERYWGGYADYTRSKQQELTILPDNIDLDTAMTIGTAGFTAMLAINAIKDNIQENHAVAVTGAAGGVGSWAIYLLNKMGYTVTAITRKQNQSDYLTTLGATNITTLTQLLQETPERPLNKPRFGGVIDTIAGDSLPKLLSQLHYQAKIACCGLVAGRIITTTVMPLLIRGNSLIGIDSVMASNNQRTEAWQQLSTILQDTDSKQLHRLFNIRQIPLQDVSTAANTILFGNNHGRYLVKIEN